MKDIKNIFIVFIATILYIYLGASFISGDLNIFKTTVDFRNTCFIAGTIVFVVLSLIYLMITHIDD